MKHGIYHAVWLAAVSTNVVGAYQLKTTLYAPESFIQPSTAALFVESLYHVSTTQYCELISNLASRPVPGDLTSDAVVRHLQDRTHLTEHEAGLLKLSLALNEFAPAASFNGSIGMHNCSTANVKSTVYTDFSQPFEYESGVVVRYLEPAEQKAKERQTMSGYGAHLALKRTDYLVIDDSNPTQKDLEEDTKRVEPLKFNQMSNIGLRAVSRITKADDPLQDLQDISQNFPMRTKKLLAAKVSKELKAEVQEVKTTVRGDIFMINGVEINPTPEKLLPRLRQESALSSRLQALGYNNSQVINILTFDLELPPKVDKFDVRSPAIVYLNNFEKDAMYQSWPESVETFMRPLYPGQFHSIRRNAHTVVMYADLTKAEDREVISNFAMFVTRGLPLRWGIVPASDTPEKAILASAWQEVIRTRGVTKAVEFLAAAIEGGNLSKVYEQWQKAEGATLGALESLATDTTDEIKRWKSRFGSENLYANGRPVPRDESMLQQLSAYLRDDIMMMQEALLEGGIIDTGDLQDFFLGPNPMPTYSAALFGPRQYVSLEAARSLHIQDCAEDFHVQLSGDWPAGFMEEEDASPCIRRVDGPKQLIINGRIVHDLHPMEIPTLLAQEQADMTKYRAAATRASSPMSAEILTLIRTSNVLRTILPPVPWTDLTTFDVGEERNCLVNVEVYLDPLSENAQRWSSVLQTLRTIPRIFIRVHLVPNLNIKELPLTRFYRYLLDAEPSFSPRSLTFSDIPADLLVFSLDVWNNWVTSPVYAAVDLDNLHLGSQSINAEFEVSHILVEGHAKETKNPNPPRGAQLTLSGPAGQVTETIIMANLGYFQFKTQPGVWTLGVKVGRSSEIYDLEGREIEVGSWAGTTIYPRLARKSGMETAEILDDKQVASKGGLWSKLKAFSGTDVQSTGTKHADINIFTVASGHLYERFVYIMVSSVMAHTKHSVKFWFISNFLSPQFRQFIPHLAAHLNFEYEMITFSWPHWLRQQTEKQRIIWGYKILFLDVMFPLDLEKVIFVDADQIVRTDMIELINEDLKGKVWGYTPMCDSRKEIEGFRFWKQGYWKDFLRGKPYHISALYVIDLVAFRSQATGDRLRQQYHQLSADPASLSNLDQDLPNHLQAQIPIHSLSQEWLWCETWCSDESLKDAKTIDLCQNPMTKEPKLDRARRQLPEWTVYDQKIKDFAKSIAQAEKQAEGMGSIVVDVDSVGQNLEMRRDEADATTHDEL